MSTLKTAVVCSAKSIGRPNKEAKKPKKWDAQYLLINLLLDYARWGKPFVSSCLSTMYIAIFLLR